METSSKDRYEALVRRAGQAGWKVAEREEYNPGGTVFRTVLIDPGGLIHGYVDAYNANGRLIPNPDAVAWTAMLTGAPSAEALQALKNNWLRDPVWDIEETEGFEAHHDELLAFRMAKEAEWHEDALRRDTFYDWIGKPDPTLDRDWLDNEVFQVTPSRFRGLIGVHSDPTGLNGKYWVTVVAHNIVEAEPFAAPMQEIAAALRAAHPNLTISEIGMAHERSAESTGDYGFSVGRYFSADDMRRGDHFRIEILSLFPASVRNVAEFERAISAQVAAGWRVQNTQHDKDTITVALTRDDRDAI